MKDRKQIDRSTATPGNVAAREDGPRTTTRAADRPMPLRRVHGERILALPLDPASDTPMYRQVYLGVRKAIRDGVVQPGTRLPSTRALASDLRISRNTVVMAYEQLRAEGYTVGRGGSDTRVATTLPDHVMQPAALPPRTMRSTARASTLARNVAGIWDSVTPRLEQPPRAFRAGVPATDLFPYALWGRLLSRRWQRITARDLGYANPQGYLPLREAVASYLAASRGVRCTADQVFIVGGAQAGLSIAARLALDPGDRAWIENPGYHGARGALLATGARPVPIAVDAEGMRVEDGLRDAADARAAFVTPSRQLPLGVTMSAARREALLAWAARAKAWIVEDDYDADLRFATRPLPAIQGSDTHGCVLHIGTFSKVLFPSLRLGYLVVPPDLVPAALAMRHMHDVHSPTLEQMVLTDFITEGHFERHVRRLRHVYLERQQALRDGVQRHLRGMLELTPGEAGLFVVGWLPAGVSDEKAAALAAAEGVDVMPLSRMGEGPIHPGLVLGYAGLNVADIAEGVQRLTRALAPLRGLR
ncbi:MAG: PLP-dependent aminotransferase family protein [Gemmatimonadaceae bacterium]|nr:PLP-dependent aminotransferase family protein [Gemmatimonadaceae bacterium]